MAFTGVTNVHGPTPQPTACRSPTCSQSIDHNRMCTISGQHTVWSIRMADNDQKKQSLGLMPFGQQKFQWNLGPSGNKNSLKEQLGFGTTWICWTNAKISHWYKSQLYCASLCWSFWGKSSVNNLVVIIWRLTFVSLYSTDLMIKSW